MQRVRIGLTGLACVFLLVLLAAAFFGIARHEADLNAPPPATAPASDASAANDAPRDPLAELGVAPGNIPDEAANSVASVEQR
jgi:hypothetical protein